MQGRSGQFVGGTRGSNGKSGPCWSGSRGCRSSNAAEALQRHRGGLVGQEGLEGTRMIHVLRQNPHPPARPAPPATHRRKRATWHTPSTISTHLPPSSSLHSRTRRQGFGTAALRHSRIPHHKFIALSWPVQAPQSKHPRSLSCSPWTSRTAHHPLPPPLPIKHSLTKQRIKSWRIVHGCMEEKKALRLSGIGRAQLASSSLSTQIYMIEPSQFSSVTFSCS